jgi:hypothetical protein
LKVAINNLGDMELYDFSTLVKVNNTLYENSTGGPNSTFPLNPGEQAILIYFCSNTQYCAANATVENVRVSPGNCPTAWTVSTLKRKCT